MKRPRSDLGFSQSHPENVPHPTLPKATEEALALQQIELLLNEIEKVWIELGIYKMYAETFVTADRLVADIEAAKRDPQNIAAAEALLGPIRKHLSVLVRRKSD